MVCVPDFTLIMRFVFHESDVVRLQPTIIAIHFYPLVGMDHAIVNDSIDNQLVRLCGISVANNPTICRELSTPAS